MKYRTIEMNIAEDQEEILSDKTSRNQVDGLIKNVRQMFE
jgi:hypothetical protein